ncbi:MAG TPA: hypothetical protein VMB72_15575 [Acidimicrobiales bacterium]|nr:hypothetical protein [Acidimicrobiales bacterium]
MPDRAETLRAALRRSERAQTAYEEARRQPVAGEPEAQRQARLSELAAEADTAAAELEELRGEPGPAEAAPVSAPLPLRPGESN